MALKNAKLHLILNREQGTMYAAEDTTRIYVRDENITLVVDGWTLEEVTKVDGETPYEPYFRITDFDGRVLAQAKLEPSTEQLPSGNYSMHGVLSTNTRPMAELFCGSFGEVELYLRSSVFSTKSANPIATGDVEIWNFDGKEGCAPELPSGYKELQELRAAFDAHNSRVDNPHAVTAHQTGAMTRNDCDESYAAKTALEQLRQNVEMAQTAISGLSSALEVANRLIYANANAITTKANTADTYRKNETYSKGEVDQFVANLRINPIMGKNFRFKTQNETRAALATVIQLFGGVVNGAWDVIHEAATPMPYIPMSADGHIGTVKLKAVVSDGELTSEVVEG